MVCFLPNYLNACLFVFLTYRDWLMQDCTVNWWEHVSLLLTMFWKCLKFLSGVPSPSWKCLKSYFSFIPLVEVHTIPWFLKLYLFHINYISSITLIFIGVGSLGKGEFSQDIVEALELLLQFTPLLDIIDAKWPSSCVESLLTALLKVGLITEEHCKHYSKMR